MKLSIYRITRILDGTDHYYKGVKAIRVYHDKDTVKVKLKNGKQYLGHSSDIVLYND